MSLTNTSQLLMRNSDVLKAKAPLLINMPADDLNSELLALNPTSEIYFFSNNYQQYQYYQKNKQTRLKCFFAASYQSSAVHDLVVIQFPKSKQELLFTLAMLTNCTDVNSQILIVGENRSGIKSLSKLTKNNFSYCEKLDAARHCLLFQAQLITSDIPFELEHWFHRYNVSIDNTEFSVASLPGVFSQAKLDQGTAILLNAIGNLKNQFESSKVLDFGCGAGVIACFIGLTCRHSELHLTDVSALALASAKKTLEINHLTGQVFATDSLSEISEQYQHIISNPPFHQGVKTHYRATEQFLSGISPYLAPSGMLTIVANSFLHYQDMIKQSVGESQQLTQQAGFNVYQAKKKA